MKGIVVILLFLSMILVPTVYAGYDYGYEFGYVNMNGIQAIVTLYNISLQPGSPTISVQENLCLNLNGSNIFVQNVIIPSILTKAGYEVEYINSIFYNGTYHIFSYYYLVGRSFNLTTVWFNTSDKLLITFYISNGSVSLNKTWVLYGNYLGIVYSGYDAGTVVVGYGNGATAYLGKGFNVSISEFYRYNNGWYVPPIAYSGYPITGESALNGYAYYYNGEVWVTYGNASDQMLYNFSVIIVNNTIFTFPKGSLWLANGRFFTNSIPFKEDLIISPFYYFNHSFIAKKQLLLKFNNYTEIDGIKGKTFFLPTSENVYIKENGKCIAMFLNQSIIEQKQGEYMPNNNNFLYLLILTTACIFFIIVLLVNYKIINNKKSR
ncbi:hypothetical protein [Saccharolobus sp. E5-1-F]|uniref:hypothetical protein n=1 Tax=Saccharolobus sp. E5-1-F TaxID=2663019 RepID=UPI001EE8F821|nr:hypothetical protein [Sulfolobus sp. E5-1-F]